jgi:hypothetical protein
MQKIELAVGLYRYYRADLYELLRRARRVRSTCCEVCGQAHWDCRRGGLLPVYVLRVHAVPRARLCRVCDLCADARTCQGICVFYAAVYRALRKLAFQRALPWEVLRVHVWLRHLAPTCESNIRYLWGLAAQRV